MCGELSDIVYLSAYTLVGFSPPGCANARRSSITLRRSLVPAALGAGGGESAASFASQLTPLAATCAAALQACRRLSNPSTATVPSLTEQAQRRSSLAASVVNDDGLATEAACPGRPSATRSVASRASVVMGMLGRATSIAPALRDSFLDAGVGIEAEEEACAETLWTEETRAGLKIVPTISTW